MRKQTKKVLSWVLAGAMALSLIPSVGLVSEKADAAVSTVDKVVFDKAVESLSLMQNRCQRTLHLTDFQE